MPNEQQAAPPKLIFCPFCHDTAASLMSADYKFWVECRTCHSRTAEFIYMQQAVERWNHRHSSVETQELAKALANTPYYHDRPDDAAGQFLDIYTTWIFADMSAHGDPDPTPQQWADLRAALQTWYDANYS
jgi:hypothetical protein